jgi:hypothetical protein
MIITRSTSGLPLSISPLIPRQKLPGQCFHVSDTHTSVYVAGTWNFFAQCASESLEISTIATVLNMCEQSIKVGRCVTIATSPTPMIYRIPVRTASSLVITRRRGQGGSPRH